MKHTYEERRNFAMKRIAEVSEVAEENKLYFVLILAEAPEELSGEMFSRVFYAEEFDDFIDLFEHYCFRYDNLGVKYWIETNSIDYMKNGGFLND